MSQKEPKYLSPRHDTSFHKIFAHKDRREVLIAFLNGVLDLRGEERIQRVEVCDSRLSPTRAEKKRGCIDLLSTDQRNQTFLIEVQLLPFPFFHKRILWYASKLYANQLEEGKSYSTLRPVHFLGILQHTLFPEKEPFSRHILLEEKRQTCYLTDMSFSFLELPKLPHREEAIDSERNKWTYFLQLEEGEEELPQILKEDPLIMSAHKTLERMNWSEEELRRYTREKVTRTDWITSMEYNKEKGREEGLQEGEQIGIAKGEQMKAKKMAQKLLQMGMILPQQVAEVTGLPLEEIEKMQRDL